MTNNSTSGVSSPMHPKLMSNHSSFQKIKKPCLHDIKILTQEKFDISLAGACDQPKFKLNRMNFALLNKNDNLNTERGVFIKKRDSSTY